MAIDQEAFRDKGESGVSPEAQEWVDGLPMEQEMMARAMRMSARTYQHDGGRALCTEARVAADAEVQEIQLEVEMHDAYLLEQRQKALRVRFPLGDATEPLSPHIWN